MTSTMELDHGRMPRETTVACAFPVVSGRVIPQRLRKLDDSIVAGVGEIDVTQPIECDPFVRRQPPFGCHRRWKTAFKEVLSFLER